MYLIDLRLHHIQSITVKLSLEGHIHDRSIIMDQVSRIQINKIRSYESIHKEEVESNCSESYRPQEAHEICHKYSWPLLYEYIDILCLRGQRNILRLTDTMFVIRSDNKHNQYRWQQQHEEHNQSGQYDIV